MRQYLPMGEGCRVPGASAKSGRVFFLGEPSRQNLVCWFLPHMLWGTATLGACSLGAFPLHIYHREWAL